jgi:hypothetical protein
LAVYNILSTRVVLPWSTCAMMAIFLMFCIFFLCAHMYAHIAHIMKKPAKLLQKMHMCKKNEQIYKQNNRFYLFMSILLHYGSLLIIVRVKMDTIRQRLFCL